MSKDAAVIIYLLKTLVFSGKSVKERTATSTTTTQTSNNDDKNNNYNNYYNYNSNINCNAYYATVDHLIRSAYWTYDVPDINGFLCPSTVQTNQHSRCAVITVRRSLSPRHTEDTPLYLSHTTKLPI